MTKKKPNLSVGRGEKLSVKKGAGNAFGDFLRSGEHYIYFHRNPFTDEIFYIGLGKYFRCNQVCKGHRNKYWTSIYEKYGRSVEIVKSGLTLDEAKKLEIEYIAKYNPRANFTKGGDGISDVLKVKVYSYDLDGNYVASYESLTEAQVKMTGSPLGTSISRVLDKQNRSRYSFMWSSSKKKKIPPYKKTGAVNIKEIHCYDSQGLYVTSYKKIANVVKDGFSRTGVSNALNKNNKTCSGHFFSESKFDSISVSYCPALKESKKVICNKTGKIFSSIQEASNYLGCNRETLRRKLNGLRRNNTNMSIYNGT